MAQPLHEQVLIQYSNALAFWILHAIPCTQSHVPFFLRELSLEGLQGTYLLTISPPSTRDRNKFFFKGNRKVNWGGGGQIHSTTLLLNHPRVFLRGTLLAFWAEHFFFIIHDTRVLCASSGHLSHCDNQNGPAHSCSHTQRTQTLPAHLRYHHHHETLAN